MKTCLISTKYIGFLLMSGLLTTAFPYFSASGNTARFLFPEPTQVNVDLPALNLTETIISAVQSELDKARNEGKVVFLVVTGAVAADNEKAIAVAVQANKLKNNSAVIKMNRDDQANKDLVSKFGIAGVAPPLILVISPGGVAVGGYQLDNATAENLLKLLPSPKKDEVLVAINNKMPVFVIVSKKSFTDQVKSLESCKSALTQMGNNAKIVQMDLDDSKEMEFINQLGVNTVSATTATVVINTAGQITGTYYGPADATILANSAKKVMSGCCPGSSKKSCGK
ncbi:MAG: hypothetical protein NT175_07035 [Bacteroidetes bacterium]|nr:hypothetical protein [Bacteroidota bacterium]